VEWNVRLEESNSSFRREPHREDKEITDSEHDKVVVYRKKEVPRASTPEPRREPDDVVGSGSNQISGNADVDGSVSKAGQPSRKRFM
jgi:hypothetical protein